MAVSTTSNARNTRKAHSSKPARNSPVSAVPPIDPERRRALIAEAAYFRAERRGFEPGYETQDWLAAETEVDTALTVGVPSTNTPAMQ